MPSARLALGLVSLLDQFFLLHFFISGNLTTLPSPRKLFQLPDMICPEHSRVLLLFIKGIKWDTYLFRKSFISKVQLYLYFCDDYFYFIFSLLIITLLHLFHLLNFLLTLIFDSCLSFLYLRSIIVLPDFHLK